MLAEPVLDVFDAFARSLMLRIARLAAVRPFESTAAWSRSPRPHLVVRVRRSGRDHRIEGGYARDMADMTPEDNDARRGLGWALIVVVVVAGAAVLAISLTTADHGESLAAVATSALTVVGSIGGGFIGHRLGSSQTRKAERRAAIYERHLSPGAHVDAQREIGDL
jgi:hypothetical protein